MKGIAIDWPGVVGEVGVKSDHEGGNGGSISPLSVAFLEEWQAFYVGCYRQDEEIQTKIL